MSLARSSNSRPMPPASTVCSWRYQAKPSTPTTVMLPPKQPKRSTRQTSTPARAAARAAASPPGPDPTTNTSVLWMTGVCRAGSVMTFISSSMEWQFTQGAVDDSCRATPDDTVAQLMPFRPLGRDAQGLDSVHILLFFIQGRAASWFPDSPPSPSAPLPG